MQALPLKVILTSLLKVTILMINNVQGSFGPDQLCDKADTVFINKVASILVIGGGRGIKKIKYFLIIFHHAKIKYILNKVGTHCSLVSNKYSQSFAPIVK